MLFNQGKCPLTSALFCTGGYGGGYGGDGYDGFGDGKLSYQHNMEKRFLENNNCYANST